jgi:hypothetical protein
MPLKTIKPNPILVPLILLSASMHANAGANLKVNGVIQASSVKTNNWTIATPDYVFEKDYELASLSNVETFVKEKKHLPEVPSAMEMKKEGMDLAEMNMRLLKKVEELTLYAIGQSKTIEKQQDQLTEQSQRLSKLELKLTEK